MTTVAIPEPAPHECPCSVVAVDRDGEAELWCCFWVRHFGYGPHTWDLAPSNIREHVRCALALQASRLKDAAGDSSRAAKIREAAKRLLEEHR